MYGYLSPNSVMEVAMESPTISGPCGFRVTRCSFDPGSVSAGYVTLGSYLNSQSQFIICLKWEHRIYAMELIIIINAYK